MELGESIKDTNGVADIGNHKFMLDSYCTIFNTKWVIKNFNRIRKYSAIAPVHDQIPDFFY